MQERWATIMRALDLSANSATATALCAAYAEPHRHYHTLSHLRACLGQLDRCSAKAEHPAEIELALWFHDAIYRPMSTRNERDSADWALRFLTANSARPERMARVERLIMVTEHGAATSAPDESLLVDVDLSILGESAETYARFEAAVRREYRMVPMLLYRRKRIEVLQKFLQRPKIYQNEPFISQLEAQARRNLTGAIEKLRG